MPKQNTVSPAQVYAYLRQKGVPDSNARGMLANIQAESGFRTGVLGDNNTSGGLFQHHNERFTAMRQAAGENWAENWRGQIDFALSEPAGQAYLRQNFQNPADASRWFTVNFEVPKDKHQKAEERVGNLRNFAQIGEGDNTDYAQNGQSQSDSGPFSASTAQGGDNWVGRNLDTGGFTGAVANTLDFVAGLGSSATQAVTGNFSEAGGQLKQTAKDHPYLATAASLAVLRRPIGAAARMAVPAAAGYFAGSMAGGGGDANANNANNVSAGGLGPAMFGGGGGGISGTGQVVNTGPKRAASSKNSGRSKGINATALQSTGEQLNDLESILYDIKGELVEINNKIPDTRGIQTSTSAPSSAGLQRQFGGNRMRLATGGLAGLAGLGAGAALASTLLDSGGPDGPGSDDPEEQPSAAQRIQSAAGESPNAARAVLGGLDNAGRAMTKVVAEGLEEVATNPRTNQRLTEIIGRVISRKGPGILGRAVPFLGTVISAGMGIKKFIEGDMIGAGLAATGLVPGLGIATTLGVAGYEIAREVYNEFYDTYPEDDPLVADRLQEVISSVSPAVTEWLKENEDDEKYNDMKDSTRLIMAPGMHLSEEISAENSRRVAISAEDRDIMEDLSTNGSGYEHNGILSNSVLPNDAQLNNLSTRQLEALIRFDDWSSEDEERLKNAYIGAISSRADTTAQILAQGTEGSSTDALTNGEELGNATEASQQGAQTTVITPQPVVNYTPPPINVAPAQVTVNIGGDFDIGDPNTHSFRTA